MVPQLPCSLTLTETRSWHHDLNPDNILVVSRGGDSPYDCDFKIADLGLAHFKRHHSSMHNATDEGQHGSNAYSKDFAFLSFRLELTFQGAPESYRSTDLERSPLQVLQSVDIWSMGCIFSEVATWVTEGYLKVLEYRRRRQMEVQDKGGTNEELFYWDCKILETVTKILDEIVANSRLTDYVTPHVVEQIVRWMVVEDAHSRAKAHMFVDKSTRIVNEAKQKLNPPRRNHTVSNGILEAGRRMPPNLPPGPGSRTLVHALKPGMSDSNVRSSEASSAQFPELPIRNRLSNESFIPPFERARIEDTNGNLPSDNTGGHYQDLTFRQRQTWSTPVPNPHSQSPMSQLPATAGVTAPPSEGSSPDLVQRTNGAFDSSHTLPGPRANHESLNPLWTPSLAPAMTEEVSQLPIDRGLNPFIQNHMVESELSSSKRDLALESTAPYNVVQNEPLYPYMSVDDGLRVKRTSDTGRLTEYPDGNIIQTRDSILRDPDHVCPQRSSNLVSLSVSLIDVIFYRLSSSMIPGVWALTTGK